MNKSRIYLSSLSAEKRKILAFIVSPDKKKFHEYLYQIGKGIRTPSRKLSGKLQIATKGKVKQSDFDKEALSKLG